MSLPRESGAANERCFRVLGLEVALECDDPPAAEALDGLLAPFAVAGEDHAAARCRFRLAGDARGVRTLACDAGSTFTWSFRHLPSFALFVDS